MVKLDLGCGASKPEGFIGVDRFALSGVDLIADLNHFLPIKDHSADLVLCSHSLEHVENLYETMKEIYRICRHGAQVCIIAPYGQQSLNLANPFHKQIFNEDTPRFWTNCTHTLIDPKEYHHPHAGGSWGLASSDNSPAEMDFRCLRMEFFYFPEYRYLSEEEQRSARKKYLNVCDQIIYHLVAIKKPTSEDDMEEIIKQMDYYEPPYITIRRYQERSEFLGNELKQAKATLRSNESERLDLRNRLEDRERKLRDALNKIQNLENEMTQWRMRSFEEAKRYEEIRKELELYKTKMSQMEMLRDTQEVELGQLRTLLYQREIELGEAKKKVEAYNEKVAEIQRLNQKLEDEIAQFKERLDAETGQLEKIRQEKEAYKEKLKEALEQNNRFERFMVELRERLTEEGKRLEEVLKEVESHKAKLVEAYTQNKQIENQLVQMKEMLNLRERDLLIAQSSLKNRETEIEQLKSILTSREAELKETHRALEEKTNDLERFRNKGTVISSELDQFRHRKVTRLVDRFFNQSNLIDDVSPTFLQLKDDSFLFTNDLKGYRLLPSKNLQRVPFLHYPLDLDRKNLKAILLAPILDFPSENGFLGIEIVSPDGRIVSHSVISASQIDESLPTRFNFPPIQNSDQGRFWLRVFASQVDYPIRVLEWKRYGLWGFGRPRTKAFCGFLFENDELGATP